MPVHHEAWAIVGADRLAGVFAVAAVATGCVMLAVATGACAGLDERLLAAWRLRVSRRADGKPGRAATAARDLTALGGDTLRLVFLLAAIVALGCDRRWLTALALMAIFAAARLALFAMKSLVRRPRPPARGEVVATYTTSFPSGHTFMAGVLYLSAALLIPTDAPLTAAAIGGASLLSLLIGLTRVSLGIHWPSDVIAGWLASIAWTTGCIVLLMRMAA